MQIFLFQSAKDNDVAGFTQQKDGGNLPGEYAPWKALGGQVIQTGGHIAGVSGGANAVLDGISRDGYFLARSEVRIIRQTPNR